MANERMICGMCKEQQDINAFLVWDNCVAPICSPCAIFDDKPEGWKLVCMVDTIPNPKEITTDGE